MLTLKIVLLCVICAVSVRGGNKKRTADSNSLFDTHYYDELENAQCRERDFNEDNAYNIRLTRCRPLDSIIKLEPKKGDITKIVPETVIVKRCGDCGCYGNQTCLPVATAPIRKAIRHVRPGNVECGWVSIIEHVACECGCQLTANSCSNKQVFFPRECMCRCKNQRERQKCLSQNKKWSEENCSCSCTDTNVACSTGSVWIADKCKCIKLPNLASNDV